MQLLRLNDPQRIAAEAKKLGMVAPPNPTFLDLATGKILGVPAAATAQNGMNIGGTGIAPTPASLRPAPKIHWVAPPTTATTGNNKPANTGKTKTRSGASSKKAHH